MVFEFSIIPLYKGVFKTLSQSSKDLTVVVVLDPSVEISERRESMVSNRKTLAPDHCDKKEDTDRTAGIGSRAAMCIGQQPVASERALNRHCQGSYLTVCCKQNVLYPLP